MSVAATGPATALGIIDSHTCGQPTRVVHQGLPPVAGGSVAEMRDALRADHDWVRRALVSEPHGNPAVFAVALVPASDPRCAAGVVFMDAAGYHDMCGHATIGVVATLAELGRIPVRDGEAAVALETPLGVIETRAQMQGGRAVSVSFVNQPAFLLQEVTFDWGGRRHQAAIAFGGQWYAFVDAKRATGQTIEPAAIPALVAAAAEIRPLINSVVSKPDPRTSMSPRVENVMWFDDEAGSGFDGRNMPVNAAGNYDRSPCGTGTSARLALLHATGRLNIGEVYVNAGVLGTTYRGRLIEETDASGLAAVIPEITGAAWVTARGEALIDPSDPLSPKGAA
jgi:proline racemase